MQPADESDVRVRDPRIFSTGVSGEVQFPYAVIMLAYLGFRCVWMARYFIRTSS